MEQSRAQENLQIYGDVIEEPLMLICGEGSGEECQVGNEEKSSNNFFFFGQPGCLKHSPIKTFSSESITGLSSFKTSSSTSESKESVESKEKSEDISENLSTKTSNNDVNIETTPHKNDKDSVEKPQEVEDDSNKSSKENDLKTPEKHSESSNAPVDQPTSTVNSEKVNENTHSTIDNEQKCETLPSASTASVQSSGTAVIKLSIVPYDDDSSSSQAENVNNLNSPAAEIQQQQEEAKPQESETIESASLAGESVKDSNCVEDCQANDELTKEKEQNENSEKEASEIETGDTMEKTDSDISNVEKSSGAEEAIGAFENERNRTADEVCDVVDKSSVQLRPEKSECVTYQTESEQKLNITENIAEKMVENSIIDSQQPPQEDLVEQEETKMDATSESREEAADEKLSSRTPVDSEVELDSEEIGDETRCKEQVEKTLNQTESENLEELSPAPIESIEQQKSVDEKLNEEVPELSSEENVQSSSAEEECSVPAPQVEHESVSEPITETLPELEESVQLLSPIAEPHDAETQKSIDEPVTESLNNIDESIEEKSTSEIQKSEQPESPLSVEDIDSPDEMSELPNDINDEELETKSETEAKIAEPRELTTDEDLSESKIDEIEKTETEDVAKQGETMNEIQQKMQPEEKLQNESIEIAQEATESFVEKYQKSPTPPADIAVAIDEQVDEQPTQDFVVEKSTNSFENLETEEIESSDEELVSDNRTAVVGSIPEVETETNEDSLSQEIETQVEPLESPVPDTKTLVEQPVESPEQQQEDEIVQPEEQNAAVESQIEDEVIEKPSELPIEPQQEQDSECDDDNHIDHDQPQQDQESESDDENHDDHDQFGSPTPISPIPDSPVNGDDEADEPEPPQSLAVESIPVEEDVIAPVEEQQQITEAVCDSPPKSEIKDEPEPFSKPGKVSTRKRKLSGRKSISEDESDSNIATDSVTQDQSSEDEIIVKKPRMRNKTTTPKKAPVASRTLRGRRSAKSPEKAPEEPAAAPVEPVPAAVEAKVDEKIPEETQLKPEEQTIQNSLKFDFDGSEDIAAKVADIKKLICKDKKSSESEQSDDEKSNKKSTNKRSRKGKRGRFAKAKTAESSDDEDNKRKKPSSSEQSETKKRNSGRGLLKYIDTSLVIETVENEAPVRQSRRIAQIKIKEETERRQVEEKMLNQLKNAAVKKKPSNDNDYQKSEERSEEDEEESSVKGGRRKKKSTIKKSDKQWQTSSSHSEHTDQSEEEIIEHVEDPGSPLFKSDHEFSPESEDEDDAAQVQPLKRARTAKKIEVEDEDAEDINPNHACQVCHKTDSPEWILLCDECDCGYHCSCLKPIIFLIPSGNWYCPQCCHKRLITNLSDQLSKLDTLVQTIETAEVRRQRQIMLEISAQNIIEEERRKKERERPPPKAKRERSEEAESSDGSSSGSDSSDDAPLIYKLRKRNQTTTSYRFNEYDDLINSAIKEEMEEVKGAGNLGRGKDISTIIEADREEKRNLKRELDGDEEEGSVKDDEEANSSGSDVIQRKKSKKKKTRKLNTLDSSDDAQSDADESFKGSTPSSDSEVDEEELSESSVSESSLDLPRKKGAAARSLRTRTRQKRIDTFINDNDDNDSDDEPLIAKRTRKKKDSDEEEFDLNDDEDDEENSAEDIDSEDLCDDSDSSDSSESGWQKKRKKKQSSYDHKPRKPAKKKVNEDEDKAFRAGISKKKILKQQELISENESEASDDENAKSRRTRGKKLLYLIEDDLESDESDGIRPGVKRPETPPEEREMFFKKQEEIKRMLAAKDTEAAKKLALPTIEPINIPIERPETPTSIPSTDEPSSLSTIPMNVIESAKALDTDYNRAKPFLVGSSKSSFTPEKSAKDMDETELARMMEDEDFARHQLKLAGDAIAKKKLLEFEAKEDAFIGFSRSSLTLKDREIPPPRADVLPSPEKQKRPKKPKTDKAFEESPQKLQSPPMQLPPQQHPAAQHVPPSSIPPSMQPTPAIQKPLMQHHTLPPQHPMQQQPIMANYMHQPPPHSQPSIIQQTPYVPSHQSLPPTQGMPDRPSVLSSYMNRPLNHPGQPPPPSHMKIMQSSPPPTMHHQMKPLQSPPPSLAQQLHQQQHPKSFSPKNHPQLPPQHMQMQDVDMKKERKKKSSSRSDPIPEGNLSKHVKLDAPSVIHPPINPLMMEREDKAKLARMEHNMKLSVAAPPQIFNPGTAPTPSVITRLLQPQNRPPNPYTQVPSSQPPHHQPPPGAPNARMYPGAESQKHLPPVASSKIPPQQNLPPSSFADHPAFQRGIHPGLYRGPAPFGMSPHARLPPYPFPLHPNMRPGEFPASPYNIPPQFGYYAPPAHGRPGPMPHGAAPHLVGDDQANSIRNPANSEENPENSSEFGGLVSYFSSQQELD